MEFWKKVRKYSHMELQMHVIAALTCAIDYDEQ